MNEPYIQTDNRIPEPKLSSWFSETNDSKINLYKKYNLLFIDEERNKDLEKRFSTYINKYFNLDKKDSQNDIENMNNENEEKKKIK